MKKNYIVLFLITLFSCTQSDKAKFDNKDREMLSNLNNEKIKFDSQPLIQQMNQEEFEIKRIINLLAKQKIASSLIFHSPQGKQIIDKGEKVLPYLQFSFADTVTSRVYSLANNRYLKRGEIAILIAGSIKTIPIAYVVGVQQCIRPFDFNIEHYLWKIEKDPKYFNERYKEWIQEEKIY